MIKIINIELKKIFKHKSIYIILIIMTLFCLLNTTLYKKDYDNDGRYKYETEENITKEIKTKEKELTKYNINKEEDKNIYISIKNKIDILYTKRNYNKNSWQYIKAKDYLENDIYNINYYKYIDKNKKELQIATDKYNKKLLKFKTNNWRYFINIEKSNLEKEKEHYLKELNKEEDKQTKLELKNNINEINDKLEIINYRIKSNINYGNNYLNRALEKYETSILKLKLYNKKDLNYQQRIEYNELIKTKNINKYIITNKKNYEKENTSNNCLRMVADDYELFIIILILMTTSILISEEFTKGTIKLLLIKPFTRNKILLSKILAGTITILIAITILVLEQLIIGISILDIESLKLPVVIYNFNTKNIELYNVFIYMLIRIIAKMPLFIMMLILSTFLGLIINNATAPFSISILIYTFSEVINNMITKYNIKIMKYSITMNWNYKYYLFGGLSTFEYLNLKKSILIYIIYVIIIIYMAFKIFNKKNIKNI